MKPPPMALSAMNDKAGTIDRLQEQLAKSENALKTAEKVKRELLAVLRDIQSRSYDSTVLRWIRLTLKRHKANKKGDLDHE